MIFLLLWMPACAWRKRATLANVYHEAQLLQRQDELKQAFGVADQGLSRSSKEQDTAYYWRFRLLKAELLLVQGDTGGASKLLQGNIPRIAVATELQARQGMDRGRVESAVGEFKASLALYDQASRFASNGGLSSLTTEIELRRGVSLLRLGDTIAAEAAFRSAQGRAHRQQDSYLEASALADLALLNMDDARYDEAIDRFQQALTIFKKTSSRGSIARTLNNLGYCESQLGNPEKAIQLFIEAGQRARETGMWGDQQVSEGRIGDCYYNRGDFEEALVFYQRALDIARRTQDKFWIANWLYDLATTSMDMGDLRKAEIYNNRALALQKRMGNPVERLYPVLNEARLAASRNQISEAEDLYRSVITSAKAQSGLRDPESILEARSRLARLLAETGHAGEAVEQWHETLAIINATRAGLTSDEHRIAYLSSLIRFYQDYVDFLAIRGRTAEALLVAETSRARLLSERLRGDGRPSAPLTVAQLQGLARRSRTVLLSYWLAPRRSFLWVITPAGLATFVLPPEAAIAQRVEAYRRAVDGLRDPLAGGAPMGIEIYNDLIAPARSMIPEGSNVAIVPDGALYDLNFATIPIPAPQPHYWIEDVSISVAPSLGTLAGHAAPASPQPPSLLLIGGAVSADSNQFPSLPNAKSEIDDIQKQFPSARKLVLTGAAAAPQAYAASHPRGFSYIHFAAHATANREDPLDSAIILSPYQDSFKLYARDITRLPIRADLVTISACQSAGAHTFRGEGLVGFAWAFLRAGAHDVIAGLWEVDDKSTAQLMTQLYANLRHGSSPAAALRKAQLSLIHSKGAFRKPYYWAPFEVFADSLPSQPR